MSTAVRRRWALAGLVGLVMLAHLVLADRLGEALHDLQPDEPPAMDRMETELLADMGQSAPVVMAAPAPPAAEPEAAAPPEPAASRPAKKRRKPAPPPAPVASAVAPDVATASPPTDAAVATAAPSASVPEASAPGGAAANGASMSSKVGGMAFEWPLATRITFKLDGFFRGPLAGTAQVAWVRQAERYQVHIDASAGILASQRSTSEGVITPMGLEPRRYESVNRLFIRTNKPRVTLFEGDEVVLSTGERQTRLDGVQDPASHFIQLAYDLLLGRQSLNVGGTVALPMALAKKQQSLVYDVVGEEQLTTPLGEVDTFKLVPRRNPDQKDDVLAEIWVAPNLQFLPVRMLIRQGPDNYMDLQMDKPPQQRMEGDKEPAVSAAADGQEPRGEPRRLDPASLRR